METYSEIFYKKYLFYLISPSRNTRNYVTKKNYYIKSPLSRCMNSPYDLSDSTYSVSTDSTYSFSTDSILSDSILYDDDDFIYLE
jgi:hypothetical protein